MASTSGNLGHTRKTDSLFYFFFLGGGGGVGGVEVVGEWKGGGWHIDTS